ncbi:MAG: LysR family transcriptional regulator [Bacilli bacterium]|nr:LysR family transcriptional regulator [Bacilli bacterium]
MNNIRDIQTLLYDFYIVAKENGYSKAANKYSLQQSNLSRNIQALEEELNLKLLNSSNKGIELTLDGERIFKELEPIYENMNKIKDVLSSDNNEVKGEITIGTTRNIADNILSNYLTKFYSLYPNVNVNIITDSASNLNSYLVDHKIDLLIDYLPHINSSAKYDFEVVGIDSFKTCFACSNKFYDEYSKNIKNLKDLKKYKLIIPGSSRRRQFLDEILQSNNIKLNPIMQMPDSKLMADFVKQNDCIGYFIEEEVIDYDLKKIELEEELPINNIGLIYPKKLINNIAQKFVELIINK